MFNVLARLKLTSDTSPKSNQNLKAAFDKILSLDPKKDFLDEQDNAMSRSKNQDNRWDYPIFQALQKGDLESFANPKLGKYGEASFKNGFNEIESLYPLFNKIEKELKDQKIGMKKAVELFDEFVDNEINQISTYRKNLDKIKSQLEDYQKSS